MATDLREGGTSFMEGKTLPDHTRSHRQILAHLDQYGESGSDRDGTTDDESPLGDVWIAEDDPDAIVGVSMGKAQTRLKSAATPAVEKARALEESGSYFGTEPEAFDHDGDDRYWKTSDPSPERSPPLRETTTSPWKSQASAQQSSLSRILGNRSPTRNRRRASSGPTALIQSIRKILPDIPTPTLPKFSPTALSTFTSSSDTKSSDKHPDVLGDIDRENASPAGQSSIDSRVRDPKQFRQNSLSHHGLDGATVSKEAELRPHALRRITSDNSLYLRRVVTGASDFDDTTAFANVADMPNSRFKAISDSLQDSMIRMPKLSTSFRRPSGTTASQSEANITKHNTEANRGSSSHVPSNDASVTANLKPQQTSTQKETKHPILKAALAHMTGDLVIMGGYRGSVLRSAEPPHQQVWIPVKVGLNLRKVDLEVGLTREEEERMVEKIIPSGILSHIGPIDISRRLLKKIRKCSQVRSNQLRVHDWGYDWRLSPHLLAAQLIEFLESLQCNQADRSAEYKGATVIAHSLGGLITRHAVNQRPDLFRGVVYVGTPQNCVNILGPLRNGDDVLLSSRVLTAQVNFTLRTSFALLPENGRCFLNKDTGERYDVDFFDPRSWDDLHLSPCIKPALTLPVKRRSIVGSISGSISSFAPSLPGKRSSWFVSNDAATSQNIKEKASDAKEHAEATAKSAIERLPSPEDTVGQSLEPSMKSPNKPSIATNVTIPKEKAYEYLTRTLAEIKQFKSELAHREDHQQANVYPPIATIFGQGVPTVYGAKVASREAIKYSDAYDDLAFASGDGVVLASAAQLPIGYRCVKGGRVKSDRGHVGLLGDLEAIGQCLGAVVEGRKRGIGRGPEYKNNNTPPS